MSETPSNGDDQSTVQYQARKDKQCQFCHQAFTSSSLGRHYDLWIKPEKPKAEDGVHNVDEIRRIRGAVTRRQAKNPNGSRRYSTASAATATATPNPTSRRSPAPSEDVTPAAFHSIRPSAPTSPLARKDGAAAIPGFNVHNFAVTGVINNIDRDAAPSTSEHSRQTTTRQAHIPRDILATLQDAKDTNRAAELALREIVGSLRAAKYALPPIILLAVFSSFGYNLV